MIINTPFLFYFNIEKSSDWNKATVDRTSIEDVQQLEYDEHDIELIADRGK